MQLKSLLFLLLSVASSTSFAADNLDRRQSTTLEGYASTNGGTTGGTGGTTTTVTTSAALTSAIAGNAKKIVLVSGIITVSSGTRFRPGSNTTIQGVGSSSGITGGGITIASVQNVIIRNLIISKVVGNDAITIQAASRVWIDHNEFTSDLTHGSDYYDGAVDIVRGSDWITVSYNYFHEHWKTSLVGNDPDLGSTDTGHLHVTYHHNHLNRLYTRTPAMRFGYAHVYNNYFENILAQAVHTRSSGNALVEYNVFRNTTEAISSYGKVIPQDSPNDDPAGDYEPNGFANERNNDFGGAPINITAVGTYTTVPYTYSITPLASVTTVVLASAGVGKI